MTQKAINYAEVLCELNIDAAELSDMEAVVRENPELQAQLFGGNGTHQAGIQAAGKPL